MWETNKNLIREIKACLFALLFILIAIPTAWSVTRILSDTQDTAETFIKNTNGNYWEATASNVQVAIDDLNNNSGTVWLPGGVTFTILSTLVIEEDAALDMGGSTIVPSSNFDVIEMTVGSQLRNGIINVSSVVTFDKAVITFRATDGIGFSKKTPRVHNMKLISDGLRGKGVYLHTEGTANQFIEGTEFYNIKTNEFEYGIVINHTGTNGYINGNGFSNIMGYGDKYFITLYEEQAEASGNFFHNVQCNCTNNTEYIVWNNGQGNTFDTVIAYNWDNNGGTRASYNFSEPGIGHDGGDQCFVSFRGGSDDLAFGTWNSTTNRYTVLDFENSSLTIGYTTVLG